MIKNIRGVDIVASGCAKAAAYGLFAGMRLADARALCPDVITEDYNPTADYADLHHLAYGHVVIALLPRLIVISMEYGLMLLVLNICLVGYAGCWQIVPSGCIAVVFER